MNAPLAAEQARYRRLALSRTAAGLEQRILNGADRVAAVSKAVRDHVVGLGVLPGRVEVLPNGVDIDRFHPTSGASPVRRELGLDQAFVIGFVGGLKAWHGVDGLLDACAGLPGDLPWRLLLVGDGPLRDALTRQAAALGISWRVIFTGALPYDQVPVTLAAFDVAVAPYPALDDFYFSPLKLFEYMAMARPVVASNLGQIAEVVAHDQTGWLVPPGDVEALRGALAHLASDPDLRGRLGAAARLYVSAQHTWVANAQRILSWVSGLSGVGSLDRVSGLGQPVTGDRPPGWAGGAEP